MSDPTDAFLTLAELGLGLAGFSGIVLALTRRESPLDPVQIVLVRELILNSLAVILLALLPVALSLLGRVSPWTWRALSTFHVALILAVAWPSLFLQVRRIPHGPRAARTIIVVVLIGVVAVVVQGLNALSVLPAPAGAYFVGVCGPLTIGAIQFGRVLFGRLF